MSSSDGASSSSSSSSAPEVSEEVLKKREELHTRCETMKSKLIQKSKYISYMMEQLYHLGSRIDVNDMFVCQSCEGVQAAQGGFTADPRIQVVLCEDKLVNKRMMENTMIHEMIHAFDHSRAKVDWSNTVHHACSEIRAARLSGDCHASQEFLRGHFNVAAQHQVCVRRRAELSVRQNPNCHSDADATRAVDQAWSTCFNDIEPFTRVP